MKTSYKTQNYSEDTWAKRLADDPSMYKASVDYSTASSELELKKADLNGLIASNPQVYVQEAESRREHARALETKARLAIDLCTIKPKSAGTIEHVTIGPGSTLGVGTRKPALWLIPSGQRIVRAEIEAEFAHKVGKELEGKDVMIFDNTDSRLSYRGKVRTESAAPSCPKRPERLAAYRFNECAGSCHRDCRSGPTQDPATPRRPARACWDGPVTSLARSFSACRAITSRANSSFPIAFCLLPRTRQRAMDALYAFMRLSDDLADEPGEVVVKRAGPRGLAQGARRGPRRALLTLHPSRSR